MTINPITIGAICHRTGVPVDYDFGSVVCLAHMDDQGGSPVSPINSCPRGTNLVLHGTASISNTTPLFGTGCLNTTGVAGSFLESGTSSDYTIGLSSYTLEFAVRTSNPSQTAFLYALDKTGSTVYFSMIIAGGAFQPRESNLNVGGGGTVATSTWQRVAVVRQNGGTTTLYIDGIATGVTWLSSSNFQSDTIRWGGDFRFGSFLFSGQIDEFRLSLGLARYTANYTPAAVAFPNS